MKGSSVTRKRFLSKNGPTPAERKWRPLVEEWRRSGLEAAAFCRGRGLALSAFKFWKTELPIRDQRRAAEQASREAGRRAMRMLPVRVVESAAAVLAIPIEVVLRGGRVLRLAGDFEPSILCKLVSTLEEIQ
jgi:hypothetical protein